MGYVSLRQSDSTRFTLSTWGLGRFVGIAFKRRAAGIGRLTSLLDRRVSVNGCGSSYALPSVGGLDHRCRISQSAIFGTFVSLGSQKVVSSAPKGNCCIAGGLAGVLLLLSRCSPFGCSLCGDFVGGLSVGCGMSLLFRRCGRQLFGAVLHRSVNECGGCVIVGFSGRGLSPRLCGVSSSGLLLLSFKGFSGGSCSCMYRSFSSSFCRTLTTLGRRLEGCRELMLLFPRSVGRPHDDYRCFGYFYRSCRVSSTVIRGASQVRIHGKRMCVTVHRVRIIGVVGRDQAAKLGYKRSFKLVTCGSAPTCRMVSRKVAMLDVG